MGERFRDSTTWPARWPALVRCPRCGACGRAVPDPDGRRNVVRLTCTGCGLAVEGTSGGPARGEVRLTPIDGQHTARNPDTREVHRWPDDPDQVHPLWLRTTCCGGELLWAVNEEHLAYLEDYLGAELRERPEAVISPMGRRWVGKGLSWQLPDWMKAAKHRDEVVAALAKLRATLPAATGRANP